jgi:type III pantothenate kinase
MLLAVDVGNTQTVLGVFQGGELAWHWRIATQAERTSDELALLFGGFLSQRGLSFSREITGVAIASVVPDQTHALRQMVRDYFHFSPVVVEPGVKTGMPILTDNPKEVGADRIASALAALSAFGGPCIVVDFGTATTYDAVSEDGEYLGGVIAPGIQISATALFTATARLQRVELGEPRVVIGKNTVESVLSGLIHGTAAEVDGVVELMQKELGGHATVVATGGLAEPVIPHCTSIDHHDAWLTLKGLRLIFEKNTARDECPAGGRGVPGTPRGSAPGAPRDPPRAPGRRGRAVRPRLPTHVTRRGAARAPCEPGSRLGDRRPRGRRRPGDAHPPPRQAHLLHRARRVW